MAKKWNQLIYREITNLNEPENTWTFLTTEDGRAWLRPHMKNTHGARLEHSGVQKRLVLFPGTINLEPGLTQLLPTKYHGIELEGYKAVIKPEYLAKMLFLLKHYTTHSDGWVFFPTENQTILVSYKKFNIIQAALKTDKQLHDRAAIFENSTWD